MLQMIRTSGKVILMSVVAVSLLGSCMKDHSNGVDYITHPYLKDGYYSDGKLFYDMDQTTASVVGSDGGASEIIIPDAIEINEVTYPVGRIKNLGIFKNPENYSQLGVTPNTALASLQLGPCVAAIKPAVEKKDVFFEEVELNPRNEDIYLPALALSTPLKRRYPIRDIVVRSGNPIYDAREGSNCLIHYPSARVIIAGLNAKIPPAIKEIDPCAFAGCEGLAKDGELKLPAGLLSIGYSAFQNCTLERMSLPSTLEAIGVGAFFDNHLKEVVIPSAVMEIGDYAFADNDLTTISVAAANEFYDSRNNCNAIIETATNALIQGCNNTVIPSSVKAINPCAFYECKLIETIQLPDSLAFIGDHAFMNCISLDSICIPDATTSIGRAAFYGCKELTQVVLPKKITIGEGAFRNCDGLAQIGAFVKVAFDDPSEVDPAVFSFSNDQKAYQLIVPEEAEERFQASEWKKYFMSITTYK